MVVNKVKLWWSCPVTAEATLFNFQKAAAIITGRGRGMGCHVMVIAVLIMVKLKLPIRRMKMVLGCHLHQWWCPVEFYSLFAPS